MLRVILLTVGSYALHVLYVQDEEQIFVVRLESLAQLINVHAKMGRAGEEGMAAGVDVNEARICQKEKGTRYTYLINIVDTDS